ncbi:MAG: hypothetical protein VCA38_19260 [Roseibacillus sp.]|jgi:hypothetical protein
MMSGEMLPQPPQPPQLEGTLLLEPARLKVFGIIHIVFGALGLIGGLFSFVIVLGVNPLLNWLIEFVQAEMEGGPADPGAEALTTSLEAMKTLMSDLALLNWIKTITALIVAVLILRAGLRLVKKRKTCVASSNVYSICSIGARLLYLGIFLVTGTAAMKRYYEALENVPGMGSASLPGGMDMSQLQQIFGVGGTVVGSVMALIYPVLALVMLSKPVVKDYLEKAGT